MITERGISYRCYRFYRFTKQVTMANWLTDLLFTMAAIFYMFVPSLKAFGLGRIDTKSSQNWPTGQMWQNKDTY